MILNVLNLGLVPYETALQLQRTLMELRKASRVENTLLLLEHPLGDIDKETINIKRISELCAADWGLWRTTTMNLDKVRRLAQGYEQLTSEQKDKINSQVELAMTRFDQTPKTMAWQLRARVGDRVKWYKDVDEVH